MSLETVGQAKLSYEDKELTFDVIEGTEGERAIKIGSLRKETGLITYDPGYVNTGSCLSDLTFINGEEGILRHMGYAIEDLAEHCMFLEVVYLLIHGQLPSEEQMTHFRELMAVNAMVPEAMSTFFHRYPERAHPMAILSAMVVSLSTFHPEVEDDPETDLNIATTRLLSKLRTLATFSYKQSIGEPFVYPSHKMNFTDNILNMMFYNPVNNYEVDPVMSRSLNQLLILHADHEQNCSTSVVRMVGSSGANLYASISAGINALWGPLHGGANQAVLEMLERIQAEGIATKDFMEKVKTDKDVRLMGFGHRVYKSYDPRARIAKQACEDVLEKLGITDPILDTAKELEEIALNDEYFIERNLYPNVDYYTGITYRALGFPTNMFTVLFAIGRLPGWIAQWKELHNDPDNRIGRPRQIYTGEAERKVVPIAERG